MKLVSFRYNMLLMDVSPRGQLLESVQAEEVQGVSLSVILLPCHRPAARPLGEGILSYTQHSLKHQSAPLLHGNHKQSVCSRGYAGSRYEPSGMKQCPRDKQDQACRHFTGASVEEATSGKSRVGKEGD